MLRELACLFPRMQAALSRMNEAAGDQPTLTPGGHPAEGDTPAE